MSHGTLMNYNVRQMFCAEAKLNADCLCWLRKSLLSINFYCFVRKFMKFFIHNKIILGFFLKISSSNPPKTFLQT